MRFEGTKNTTIYEQGSKYSHNFSGQAYITNLADGQHKITVYYGAVNKISYVGTPQEIIYYSPNWQATSQFYVDGNFAPGLSIIPSPTPSPTPTPSQSIPTINKDPTLPVELSPSMIYIILAIVILIAAIALISLIYINRRRKIIK